MNKPRVINLYAGPGTGKSTTCAALFAECKYRGLNVEMSLEYAKKAAWEGRLTNTKIIDGREVIVPSKLALAQDYIFGAQSFELSRVAGDVDFVITDAPLLLAYIYHNDDSTKALKDLVLQTYHKYENLNIFLERSPDKPYNPKGRSQTEEEAIQKDKEMKAVLDDLGISYETMVFNRNNVDKIFNLLWDIGWDGNE